MIFYILPGKSVKKKILIYNDSLPRPNSDDAGAIVRRPMGLSIMTGCDRAWIQTRDCSDTLDHCATREP
jgi:hypothetical protein